MPEYVKKRLEVTFKTGLPLGTHGHFKYEGAHWIALPAKKLSRITAVIDRFVGIFAGIQRDTVRMINDHPEDTPRIMAILERVTKYRELHRELVTEKIRSQTE